MTMSTHKSFFGPQHGALVGNVPDGIGIKEMIQRCAFPGLHSNHHLGAVAGVGIAADELRSYGKDYAKAVCNNAKFLAAKLVENGFKVIGEDFGYTKSHVVLVDLSNLGNANGAYVQDELEKHHILANKNLLPWDPRFGRNALNPTGLRIGVQEVTRLGFGTNEMEEIAIMMRKVLIDGQPDTKAIKEKAEEIMTRGRIYYC
jgi:glycine hydroxymethyltransferase